MCVCVCERLCSERSRRSDMWDVYTSHGSSSEQSTKNSRNQSQAWLFYSRSVSTEAASEDQQGSFSPCYKPLLSPNLRKKQKKFEDEVRKRSRREKKGKRDWEGSLDVTPKGRRGRRAGCAEGAGPFPAPSRAQTGNQIQQDTVSS